MNANRRTGMILLTLLAACGACRHLQPRTPFADETFVIGQRFYLKQDYAAARTRFEEYLRCDLTGRERAKGLYWLGRCDLVQSRPSLALSAFDRALRCPPDSQTAALIQLARGDALAALGRHDEAAQTYQGLIDRSASEAPVDVAMFRLSQSLQKVGRSAEAARVMADLRRLFPESPMLGAEAAAIGPMPGAYSVQVGAFASRSTAEARMRQLIREGFDARIERIDSLYHVRVGRFDTREAAALEARRLGRSGYSTLLVR